MITGGVMTVIGTVALVIVGVIAVLLVVFLGKALLMVLEAVLELIVSLLSSGCFWIVLGVVALVCLFAGLL